MPPELWRHCSGGDNPADILSRGRAPFEVSVNTLWRNGSNWLPEAEDGEADDNQEIPDECLSETKAKDRTQVQGLLVQRLYPLEVPTRPIELSDSRQGIVTTPEPSDVTRHPD